MTRTAEKPRCAICGLRIEKVPTSRYPDAGRWSHLMTVAGREAEQNHKPRRGPVT